MYLRKLISATVTRERAGLFLLIWLCSATLYAQQNRYVVFFRDKASTPYSVSSPEAFLSARAIERRTRQEIAITETDLPVDPAYLNGITSAGANVYFTTKWLNAALVQTDQANVPAIEALSYVDSVVLAAPGQKLTSTGREFEATGQEQVQAFSDTQVNMLGVDVLQQDGFTGEGVLIAFFDGGFTGVETVEAFQHIYSSNRMLYTLDLVTNSPDVYRYSSHGTKVFSVTAGLLAGSFTGTGYGADYMLFVTEDAGSEYRIEEYNWLIAAEKADSAGVDIISSSVGYFDFDDTSMNYSYDDMDGQTTIITKAASLAAERGMVVVVSAGNEGDKAWHYITAPADAENVLAVGSVTPSGTLSSFSSVGPTADGRVKPDVVALGSGTTLISETGTVTTGSGTSFSTPLITGMAASLWQAYPDLTNLELMELIRQNSSNDSAPNNEYGYGIPNYKFIVSATDMPDEHLFTVFPNPVYSDRVTVHLQRPLQSQVSADIYDINGRLIDRQQVTYSPFSGGIALSLSPLIQGVYHLVLRTDSRIERFRLVKR